MTISVEPNQVVVVGYTYPTWYITPLSVEDAAQQGVMQLQRLKGVKYVYVVIDRADKARYIASDVNLLTQEYSDLVGLYKSILDVNITLILQHKENNISAEDLFSYVENLEDDYWVFKEQLQGIGYTHQVCVWNKTSGTFSLTAIDVETKLKGKRYLSGST
jgi:hypothetical protein